MPELDFANKVALTSSSYTTPKAGAVMGYMASPNNNVLSIDGYNYVVGDGSHRQKVMQLNYIPAGSTIIATGANNDVSFVPYK